MASSALALTPACYCQHVSPPSQLSQLRWTDEPETFRFQNQLRYHTTIGFGNRQYFSTFSRTKFCLCYLNIQLVKCLFTVSPRYLITLMNAFHIRTLEYFSSLCSLQNLRLIFNARKLIKMVLWKNEIAFNDKKCRLI